MLKENLQDKIVRLITGSIVKVTGGFGCSPTARGNTIFVEYPDGDSARFTRNDVDRLATEEEENEFKRFNSKDSN
jgi:hypothetical protein